MQGVVGGLEIRIYGLGVVAPGVQCLVLGLKDHRIRYLGFVLGVALKLCCPELLRQERVFKSPITQGLRLVRLKTAEGRLLRSHLANMTTEVLSWLEVHE